MTEPTPLRAATIALPHGFFTRRGGVSTGPYASLNCSLSGQDDPHAVRQNRARAANTLGATPDNLVGLHQVHGPDVIRVTTTWRPGEGPKADAMVTDRPGIALGIVTADCAPVLFADDRNGIVGAAHAGWRGAVAGVLEATIAAMLDLGAKRQNLRAAIGPCIAQCSYEVGADLRDAVLSHSPDSAIHFASGARPQKWQFDLPGYCAARLTAAGVATVSDVAADTLAREADFFSHRRRTLAGGGAIGHQISVIVCPGP